MASLTTKSLGQIVQSWTAAAQAACLQVLDFSIGSVNLAIAEATGAVALWLQREAIKVLGLTRFATSFAADADSWGAQFAFARLGAVAASGQVVFFRSAAVAINPTVIPLGSRVASADGTLTYAVYLDSNSTSFSATQGGYVLPAGQLSVTVPVACTKAGPGGNVAAAKITALVDAVASVESVTNEAAFTNGVDQESDAAYKARFPLYLAGLATGNEAAVKAAIANTQQGLQSVVIEQFILLGVAAATLDDSTYLNVANPFPQLNFDPGAFTVIIDDGSGEPPDGLLQRIRDAIGAIRGFTIRFAVFAPVVIAINVEMTIAIRPGYVHQTVAGAVQVAVTNFLNAQPLGAIVLPITRLAQVAYDASAGVANVSQITIQGAVKDLSLSKFQLARAGLVAVF